MTALTTTYPLNEVQTSIPVIQSRRGDPAMAIIRSAMSQTKQLDAFEFRDREDQPIRVERVKLAHYGYCYRVHHNFVTYVLPYTTTATRKGAAVMVMEYLRENALWPTLKLMPGKAFTFHHAYRGDEYSSKQIVIRGE